MTKQLLVSVLAMAARVSQQSLFALLNSRRVIIERRTVRLPNYGEVALGVVFTDQRASGNMDWLEFAVRTQAQYMGTYPTSHVSLWVHSGGGGSGGVMGRLSVGSFKSPGTVAHEAGHIYWPFATRWIAEGGAIMLEKITERARIGTPVAFDRRQLRNCAVDTLSELERRTHRGDQGACPYVLGSGFFVELFRRLGEKSFQQGFQNLYHKLNEQRHEDQCHGLEWSACYVKQAFVTDASPQAAALALPIINRWFYGSERGPQ